jgi:hypothetical protein
MKARAADQGEGDRPMKNTKVRDMARARSIAGFTLGDCKRCGHSPDWHRLDDSLNVSPTDPAAEFRCYGYDVEAPGTPHDPGELCDCPDYVENIKDVHRART